MTKRKRCTLADLLEGVDKKSLKALNAEVATAMAGGPLGHETGAAAVCPQCGQPRAESLVDPDLDCVVAYECAAGHRWRRFGAEIAVMAEHPHVCPECGGRLALHEESQTLCCLRCGWRR